VIDQIGMYIEAGMDEIMITGIPTRAVDKFQYIEEEILSAF